MQIAKREKIKAARMLRVQRNTRVVSVDNVVAVEAYFLLKFDSKVRIKSLRLTALKGFICLQLKKRNISYNADDQGGTRLGVTALKDLLVQWQKDEHTRNGGTGDPPEIIEVLLDDGDKDYEGVQWTVQMLYDVLATNARRR